MDNKPAVQSSTNIQRREIGDRRWGIGDGRQRRQETGNMRHETSEFIIVFYFLNVMINTLNDQRVNASMD